MVTRVFVRTNFKHGGMLNEEDSLHFGGSFSRGTRFCGYGRPTYKFGHGNNPSSGNEC